MQTDIETLIEYFSNCSLYYRWYKHEIFEAIRVITHNESIIKHFNNHREELIYLDEIINELKSLRTYNALPTIRYHLYLC